MKLPVYFLSLAFGTVFSLAASPTELIHLDLSTETTGADIRSRPAPNLPVVLPTRVVCNEGNSLKVEDAFISDNTVYGSPENKVLVLQKALDSASVSFAFEWPEDRVSNTSRLEATLGFFLPSAGQRGNVMITARSGKDIVAYIQISGGGQVSVNGMKGGTESTVQLSPIPTDTEITDFVLRLDYATSEMTLFQAGTPLGPPIEFESGILPSSLMISSSNEQTQRTAAFQSIKLLAYEP